MTDRTIGTRDSPGRRRTTLRGFGRLSRVSVGRSAGTFRLSFGWRYGGQQQQTKQQSDQFFHGQDFMLPLGSSQGIMSGVSGDVGRGVIKSASQRPTAMCLSTDVDI